jgi:hypothetical protein
MLFVLVVGSKDVFEPICAPDKVTEATTSLGRDNRLSHRCVFGGKKTTSDDIFPMEPPTTTLKAIGVFFAKTGVCKGQATQLVGNAGLCKCV